MPTTRSGRLLFLLIVFACLFVIGRNLYRRQLSERLYAAVQRSDLAAVRDLVARHADVNYIHPREDELSKMPPGIRDALFEQSVMRAAIAQLSNPEARDAEAITCLLMRNGVNLGADGERGRDYLKSACSLGKIALMQCLLDSGVDPNKHNPGEGNAIDSALDYSMIGTMPGQSLNAQVLQETKKRLLRIQQMVQLLRERGARLTATQAVQLDDRALLKSVLDAGESANQTEPNRQSALELAVSHQDIEAVKMLLEHKANVDAHTVYNSSISGNSINGTALCTAAGSGNKNLVELLLAQGANVNFRASDTTPLLSAAQMKRSDIFRLLLTHGADPKLNPLNPEQGSLLAAAISSLPQFVPELLKRGADPKGRNGDTLQAAIRAHRPDLVREFLRRGVPVNLPLNSKTPYYVSVYPRYKQPGKYDFYPFEPLGIAVCKAPECEAMLLQAGAKLGPDVPSILVAAAQAGRANIFARLLALGADVNGIDSDKETALTQAIVYAPDGVETLLKAGANPNYVNREQRMPLTIAAVAGDVKTVRLLLAHGANVNEHPPRAHTALYYARKKKNTAVVALLEKAGATDDR